VKVEVLKDGESNQRNSWNTIWMNLSVRTMTQRTQKVHRVVIP